jgi:hypothetical protein
VKLWYKSRVLDQIFRICRHSLYQSFTKFSRNIAVSVSGFAGMDFWGVLDQRDLGPLWKKDLFTDAPTYTEGPAVSFGRSEYKRALR